MSEKLKLVAPVRRAPGQWHTLPECRRILVIVHTEVYGRRLIDLLPLLEADLRIQVVFTVAPHAFNGGVKRMLRGLGAVVVPWKEAVRTRFDLALAAGSQGVEQVDAPLVRLPHGAGHSKLSRTADDAPGAPRTVGGLGRKYLTWGGKLVPAAVALAHRDELEQLRRTCPEALPVAEVVGDASFDRIAVSLRRRAAYRRALGLHGGRKLVTVCSTWGAGSAFNRLDALLPRLLGELPGRSFRVALLVHPNVWAWHGAWQVRAWPAACRRHGIAVVPPADDWRPVLIASDWIVSDHGSVGLYGAMTGAPIVMSRFPEADVDPASPGAELARTAPVLSPSRPLGEQLEYAAQAYPAEAYRRIAARISSEPGAFNRRMRGLIYRLLGLGEPAFFPGTEPLAATGPLAEWHPLDEAEGADAWGLVRPDRDGPGGDGPGHRADGGGFRGRRFGGGSASGGRFSWGGPQGWDDDTEASA